MHDEDKKTRRKPQETVNCQFFTRTGTEFQRRGLCGLGYFGGQVTFGACNRCIENGRNTVEAAKTPDIRARFRSFGNSMLDWAKQGVKMLDDARYEARLSICKGCQFFSNGSCKKCGCFLRIKLRLPTEKCPLGLWDREVYAKPKTSNDQPNVNNIDDASANSGSSDLSGESGAEGDRNHQVS